VKFWHLAVLFIVMLVVTAFLLRQNNLHMIEYRNLLKQADEQNKDIPQALANLRNYVGNHMNTSLGSGVYLEHSYQRAYDAAVQEAGKTGASAAVYQQADKDCQSLFSKTASFQAYIQCVTDKIAASGSAQDPVAAIKAPPADMYRYNFASPNWSPDVAGFAVLFTIALGLIIFGRFVLEWVIYFMLKRAHQVS
jgi:hypothetical protein